MKVFMWEKMKNTWKWKQQWSRKKGLRESSINESTEPMQRQWEDTKAGKWSLGLYFEKIILCTRKKGRAQVKEEYLWRTVQEVTALVPDRQCPLGTTGPKKSKQNPKLFRWAMQIQPPQNASETTFLSPSAQHCYFRDSASIPRNPSFSAHPSSSEPQMTQLRPLSPNTCSLFSKPFYNTFRECHDHLGLPQIWNIPLTSLPHLKSSILSRILLPQQASHTTLPLPKHHQLYSLEKLLFPCSSSAQKTFNFQSSTNILATMQSSLRTSVTQLMTCPLILTHHACVEDLCNIILAQFLGSHLK